MQALKGYNYQKVTNTQALYEMNDIELNVKESNYSMIEVSVKY
jgi:hypothetical protein